MDESQRQAMYDGWASAKKWVEVDVKGFVGDAAKVYKWIASCKIGKQKFVHHEFGDTKLQVIQRMQSWLVPKGYEISNRAELLGIDTPQRKETPSGVKLAAKNILDGAKEKRTFLEWLRLLKLKHDYFEYSEPTPEHKLKDPSMDEKIAAAELRGYQKALKDVDEIRKVKVRMPEGKIEYKP